MLRQYWATVVSRAEPMPGSVLLVLDCPSLAGLAKPGQFVMTGSGGQHSQYLRVPIPIHRIYPQGIALLLSVYDEVAFCEVGARLDFLGPGGRSPRVNAEDSIALVAMGAGMGPLMAFADSSVKRITLTTWAATARQVYPRELVPKTVEYVAFVGESAADAFHQELRGISQQAQRVFAAGGKELYTKLSFIYRQKSASLKRGQVQVWDAQDLACGLGACRGCTVASRRGQLLRCQEGPFLDLADLEF